MTINFLSIPQTAINSIFFSLNDKSRLRLREVCKSTKECVDVSILNTERTELITFEVNRVALNHIGKKVSISTLTSGDPVDVQIG
ncbi:hypothetical protein PENTCL1PPCAC_1369, partial [Pristionchus entomophagus]